MTKTQTSLRAAFKSVRHLSRQIEIEEELRLDRQGESNPVNSGIAKAYSELIAGLSITRFTNVTESEKNKPRQYKMNAFTRAHKKSTRKKLSVPLPAREPSGRASTIQKLHGIDKNIGASIDIASGFERANSISDKRKRSK